MTQNPKPKSDKKESILFKQSSELELLISAAIIFTALQISDVISLGITNLLNTNWAANSPFLVVLAVVGLYMSTLLPISIVAHFLLRIFWLSLVGLQSAFPSEDKMDGEYDGKYEKLINRSLDFNRQIHVLDQLGSSIFAFSFLTLFLFCFPFVSLSSLFYLFGSLTFVPGLDNTFGEILSTLLSALLSIFVVAYTLDFVLAGKFKRIENQYFQKIYFPIYRFMGVITLAFLSRGIYYKLSGNVSKRVIVLITSSYLLIGIFLSNAGYYSNQLFPFRTRASILGSDVISDLKYADRFTERTVTQVPFIESFIVEKGKNHIELSFPLKTSLEDSLLAHCPSVRKYNDKGVHWRKWFALGKINTPKYDSTFNSIENTRAILACFEDKMKIMIDDSLYSNIKFRFATHKIPAVYVLKGYVPTEQLSIGDHNVTIKSEEIYGSSTLHIPFLRD